LNPSSKKVYYIDTPLLLSKPNTRNIFFRTMASEMTNLFFATKLLCERAAVSDAQHSLAVWRMDELCLLFDDIFCNTALTSIGWVPMAGI